MQKKSSDYLKLFFFLLTCYPQVSRIKYEPEEKKMVFTFLLKKVEEEKLKIFERRLLSCLDLYYDLLGEDLPGEISVRQQVKEEITVLEVQRNIKYLCEEEISIIVEVIFQIFKNEIIYDGNHKNEIHEFDIKFEEDINKLLNIFKKRGTTQKLIAFREEGRVKVFDK